jgi:hypothetical protein
MVRSDLLTLIIRLVIGFIVLGLVLYLIFGWVKRRRAVVITPTPTSSLPVAILTPTPEVTPTQLPTIELSKDGSSKDDGHSNDTDNKSPQAIEEITYTTHTYEVKHYEYQDMVSAETESGDAHAQASAGPGWAEASASSD